MPDALNSSDPRNPPVPPISSRDAPRFGSAERKRALAAAFQEQGEDYDRLRPGYPDAVLDVFLAQVAAPPGSTAEGVPALFISAGEAYWSNSSVYISRRLYTALAAVCPMTYGPMCGRPHAL